MTSSYNLFQKTKIVFIHGMNNTSHCFASFNDHFKHLGFETEYVTLPGHGDDRFENTSIKRALGHFDRSMKKYENTPYVVIAFSQGALYLQLWMEKNPPHKPLKQVLLAPALAIQRFSLIKTISEFLPASFPIKSFTHKKFRRFGFLRIHEYRTILEGITTYQKIQKSLKVPSLVIVDPKDELIDTKKLKEDLEKFNPGLNVDLIERTYLNGKQLGSHHYLFDRDYYSKEDWIKITRKVEAFLGID